MLRGNLSTRPFYNERIVSFVLAVIAIAGLALAAYNATELRTLTSRRSELSRKADANEREAADITRRAENLRKSMNAAGLSALALATHEANVLIDERTFSWTEFFGHVEKTMPYDAYLLQVAPRVDKGTFRVRMAIVSKTLDEVEDFGDALEKTGAFYDVLPGELQTNEDGTLTTRLDAVYLPATAPAPKIESARAGGKERP